LFTKRLVTFILLRSEVFSCRQNVYGWASMATLYAFFTENKTHAFDMYGRTNYTPHETNWLKSSQR